jgi:hypothetical protein
MSMFDGVVGRLLIQEHYLSSISSNFSPLCFVAPFRSYIFSPFSPMPVDLFT